MKAKRGSEVQLYSFFYLGARWEWVVKAMPKSLCLQEIDPVPTVLVAG
jgi:hypothetical protein